MVVISDNLRMHVVAERLEKHLMLQHCALNALADMVVAFQSI